MKTRATPDHKIAVKFRHILVNKACQTSTPPGLHGRINPHRHPDDSIPPLREASVTSTQNTVQQAVASAAGPSRKGRVWLGTCRVTGTEWPPEGPPPRQISHIFPPHIFIKALHKRYLSKEQYEHKRQYCKFDDSKSSN